MWEGRGEVVDEFGWGEDGGSGVVFGGVSFWWPVEEKVFLWVIRKTSLLGKRFLVRIIGLAGGMAFASRL